MANPIKLLEILKWYTDEIHPITQEKLRDIPEANECMGYKNTFRRHLFSIADTYNIGEDKKSWKIIFPGFENRDNADNERNYVGPIYYNHEIKSHELDFLINQIEINALFSDEEKNSLSSRLIKSLGSVYYKSPSKSNILKIIDFSYKETNDITEKLNFLIDAISNSKMITFKLMSLNENRKLVTCSKELMVSPYKIVYYKEKYWLIGNQRLGKFQSPKGQYIKYSNSLDVFRVDRITNLQIAKDKIEKKAKYFLNVKDNLKIMSNLLVYKNSIKVDTKDLDENYGKIEFEILWNNFSFDQKYDYTFIQDIFGDKYSVTTEKSKTIVCVQSCEECIIDFALSNINKIKILDSTQFGNDVKKKLKNIVKEGLNLLD